jgi:excinuclease ABC subunit C
MRLEASLPFDAASDDESFWDRCPNRPAVFALFPRSAAAVSAHPYLSRTADLRRRLVRLLAKSPESTASPEGSSHQIVGTASPPSRASRLTNFRELISRIEYQPVGSKFEARWLLYRLNKHHYPDSYRQRLRLRPPALLKINLKNRFPRCYPTRRLTPDGSLYYGPFASRLAAERFAGQFLDIFLIRRCVEDLHPDPSHPGCIYSQMHMCLAPCFQGCTDDEYQVEVGKVSAFLDSGGQTLIRSLEAERTRASEALEFEQAAQLHRRLDKVREVLKLRPGLATNLADLNAVILQRSSEAKCVVFFRVISGELFGPATLALDERVAAPAPLDQKIRNLLEQLTPANLIRQNSASGASHEDRSAGCPTLPPWEHLAILARWYYSSSREGELVMLSSAGEIPHARIIRLCRKLVTQPESVTTFSSTPPNPGTAPSGI